MQLKNYMEVMVFEVLEHLLSNDTDVCSCKRCKLDMAAKALNSLPPKYVVSQHGEVYTKTNVLHQQAKTDVLAKVAQAIEHVKKNPKHD